MPFYHRFKSASFHQTDSRAVREFLYLAPFLYSLVAITAIVTMIIGWNHRLFLSVAISVGFFGLAMWQYRHCNTIRGQTLSPSAINKNAETLRITSISIASLMSFLTIYLIQHVTETELVLLVNLVLIVATVATICLYCFPGVTLINQFILVGPICIALVISGERSHQYLAGIVLLLSALLHIMIDGVTHLIGTHFDRAEAEAKKAARARRASDEVLNRTQPLNMEIDQNGRIGRVSDVLCSLLGISATTLRGQSFLSLIDTTYAESTAAIVRIKGFIECGVSINDIEVAILSAGGDLLIVRCHGAPTKDADEKIIGYQVWFEDKTKETELTSRAEIEAARYEDMAMLTGECFWETDTRGRTSLIVGNAAALVGPEGNAALGAVPISLAGIFNDDSISGADMSREPNRQLSDGKVVFPNGQVAEYSAIPLYDHYGNFRGYRGRSKFVTTVPSEISSMMNTSSQTNRRLHHG